MGQKPTHNVVVYDRNDYPTRVGAAWPLKKADGFSITIHAGLSISSMDGARIVLLPNDDDRDRGRGRRRDRDDRDDDRGRRRGRDDRDDRRDNRRRDDDDLPPPPADDDIPF